MQQDDLINLNIAAGQCLNSTVKQDVTFDYQGLPWKKSTAGASPIITTWALLLLLGAMVFGMGI